LPLYNKAIRPSAAKGVDFIEVFQGTLSSRPSGCPEKMYLAHRPAGPVGSPNGPTLQQVLENKQVFQFLAAWHALCVGVIHLRRDIETTGENHECTA
jgi:hypothetical protein